MTTITREQLHKRARRKVKELEFAITQSAFTSIRDGLKEELKLAEIALASLEAEPVSQTYKLPELIEGMEVSIDVSTCDADAGNRYFGTVTEVSELDTAKNGYILLVQDAEPNFDVNGNSPVQSPIDHGYRPECECSGCKATARICAELNNEEAEIFADGYNAAMLKVNKNASTELPNDANLSTNSPVIPDGYALVPVEPTDEMIAAAMNCEDVLFNSDESFCVQFGNIYEAMLAAAPKPQNIPENIPAGKSTLTPDGWISCSERMPEDEQEVIVQNKLGYRYVSYFDEHSGLFFNMPGGNQMNCIEHILVTHWMPLPAPPQK